ncbi:MAG TPA: hypothetical protein VF730_08420, partial [Terracidiphilus sp.]
ACDLLRLLRGRVPSNFRLACALFHAGSGQVRVSPRPQNREPERPAALAADAHHRLRAELWRAEPREARSSCAAGRQTALQRKGKDREEISEDEG